MNTREIIAGMLKENTGIAMMDSGGAYGRNWQENQDRDFESEPAATVDFSCGIEYTKNVYHFLIEVLEYDSTMQNHYERFCEETDPEGECGSLASMEDFPKWYAENQDIETGGIYGEGAPVMVNTYNGESALSQTLQYVYFEIDATPYVLLQIRGGMDVLGGYTDPKAFRAFEETPIFGNADGQIQCENDPDHYWNTDDAYHWYFRGTAGRQLETYPLIDIDELDTVDSSCKSLGEYRRKYEAADLSDVSARKQTVKDILIYRELSLQVDQQDLPDMEMPFDIDQVKDKLGYYTSIQDRRERRHEEIRPDKIQKKGYRWTYNCGGNLDVFYKNIIANLRSQIADLQYTQRKYHEDRSFILVDENGDGYCPICQGELKAL